MNKRKIEFNRSSKAHVVVRPAGAKLPDEMTDAQKREYCSVLSSFGESEKIIISNPRTVAYEYLYAKDVAELMNVGMSKAYELIAQTNEQLKAQGKYVIPGRVPRKLFMEQLY